MVNNIETPTANPEMVDYVRTLKENISTGLSEAHEYHSALIRHNVDAAKKLHVWWVQGVEWYLGASSRMTEIMKERLS